jgi:hypothetical protein
LHLPPVLIPSEDGSEILEKIGFRSILHPQCAATMYSRLWTMRQYAAMPTPSDQPPLSLPAQWARPSCLWPDCRLDRL